MTTKHVSIVNSIAMTRLNNNVNFDSNDIGFDNIIASPSKSIIMRNNKSELITGRCKNHTWCKPFNTVIEFIGNKDTAIGVYSYSKRIVELSGLIPQ